MDLSLSIDHYALRIEKNLRRVVEGFTCDLTMLNSVHFDSVDNLGVSHAPAAVAQIFIRVCFGAESRAQKTEADVRFDTHFDLQDVFDKNLVDLVANRNV